MPATLVIPAICAGQGGLGVNLMPTMADHRPMASTGHQMTITRALGLAIGVAAATAAFSGLALAQSCTRNGAEVSCDDGRRGLLSGDAILWPDGTRSSLSPHPSVIIGNKSSVIVGQGVFVGKGKGVTPLDNPSAPNKARCAVLDGVSYCY